MVVKFNAKKDILVGAVRKAASSWTKVKELALNIKSDGQGNYKVNIQGNGLYVAGASFAATPEGAEGETTVVVSNLFLEAVNALSSLEGEEFTVEVTEDKVVVELGTGSVEVPVVKEPKTSFELPPIYPLGALQIKTAEFRKGLSAVDHMIDAGNGEQWNNCVGFIPHKMDDVTSLSFIGTSNVGLAVSKVAVDKSTLNGEMPNMAVPVGPICSAVKYLSGEVAMINIMAKGDPSKLEESVKPFALLIMDTTGTTFLITLHGQEYSAKMLDIANNTNETASFKAGIDARGALSAIKVASVGENKVGIAISSIDGGLGVFDSKTHKKGAVIKASKSGELPAEVVVSGYYLNRCLGAYSGDIFLKSMVTGGIGEPTVVTIAGNEGFSVLLPIKNSATEKVSNDAEAKAKEKEKEEKAKDAEINGEE